MMATGFKLVEGLNLRARLLRRTTFRLWKSIILSKAKALIGNVNYESVEPSYSSIPVIILSSFNCFSDFLVLSYVFRDKDLTFIAGRGLPVEKSIEWLRSVNHVLYVDNNQFGYSFLKNLLSMLRNLNRSVVIPPEAALRYAGGLSVNPAVIVRIAMAASVPIIPVRFTWRAENGQLSRGIQKCDVWIGKTTYISPRTEEFHDVFFKKRGARKFRDLPDEDLAEIGSRIFAQLRGSNSFNGSHLQ
ncbi:MAG: hypothetical protein HY587_03655 [Candidatus Omnitrophica bacterium]|nr:hypothetical protein [Candidatus Omnitrophota bacterium]